MAKKKEEIKEEEKVEEPSFEEKIEETSFEEKIKDLEDQLLRSKAEFVNFKKRRDDETTRILKFANEDLVLSLLPVIDDFERALKMEDSHSEEVKKYKEGIVLIHENLVSVLKNFEVTEIEALDKEFDPEKHQAVFVEENKEKASDIVLEVIRKGYMLKDKVIRPSMVKINKGEDKNE